MMNRLKALLIALACVLFCHSPVVAGGQGLDGGGKGWMARWQRNPTDLVGQLAPAISLEAVIGSDSPEKLSWKSLRGKVVVLEFWATWCAPCVQSIPHFNDVAGAYTAKGVQFISITDEDRGIVERFLRKSPIHGWIGLDSDRSMIDDYGVETIPQTFVVDKMGKVAAALEPYELIPAVLDAVLAGKPLKPQKASAPVAPSSPSSSEPPSSLLDLAATLQIVIAPIREETRSMKWYPAAGVYANTQVDLQELLTSLLQLPTPLRIRWDTPMPSEKLRFVAKMPNQRADLLEKFAVPALEASLGLTITRESVEADVYVMTAPDGPLADLQQAKETRKGTHSMHQISNDGLLFATNSSFGRLAQALEMKLGRPVVDETGLTGRWNWGLSFEPNDTDSLIRGAREQLGLVLTPERRAIEMVVVGKPKAQGERTPDIPK